MKVLKFGGSSLATPERVREMAAIVLARAKKQRSLIVVSAFQGVTNQLLESARLAERNDPKTWELYEAICVRHRESVVKLLGRRGSTTRKKVDELLREYHDVLSGITLLRHCPSRAFDVVGSFGERLSSVVISAYISRSRPSEAVDAREFIVTDDSYTHATVLFDKTNPKIKE